MHVAEGQNSILAIVWSVCEGEKMSVERDMGGNARQTNIEEVGRGARLHSVASSCSCVDVVELENDILAIV